jgi:hypothetical protein
MTTTDPHPTFDLAPLDDDEDQAPSPADIGALIDELAAQAQAQADQPEPIAAGSFAMYAMPDGGVMFVTSVPSGPMAGISHHRINPGLIRAIGVLAGGGGKLQALKALAGKGRKENGRGQ